MNKFGEFPELKTERLTLRKLTVFDGRAIFEVFSSEQVMKFYGHYPMECLGEAYDLIEKFNASFEANTAIRWGIALKDSDELIGTIGFHNWKPLHARSEVGYELSERYWWKGYMKEALEAVIQYGFNTMELNRIEAMVYPENKSSSGLLVAVGFEYEGLLKEYANFRERFQDLELYAKLKD